MRIRHKIYITIAREASENNYQWKPGDTQSEKIIDVYAKQDNHDFTVTAGNSEDLTFGDITAVKGFYLEVNGDCILRINGSTDDIQLRATSSTAKCAMECDISQLTIEAQAADITGTVVFWGDLAS